MPLWFPNTLQLLDVNNSKERSTHNLRYEGMFQWFTDASSFFNGKRDWQVFGVSSSIDRSELNFSVYVFAIAMDID